MGHHNYPTTRARRGTARIAAELAAELARREYLAFMEEAARECERERRAADLAARVRAADIDPASELGQRLLRKLERTDGYLCLATTRAGTPCIALGSGNGWRCRLHGGASTGAKTPEGKARALANLRQYRDSGPAPDQG